MKYRQQRITVKVTVEKIDDANFKILTTFLVSDLESTIDRLAKDAGKHMKVDGFRKGKVPAHIVKKLHGEKLSQDAEGEAIKDAIDQAFKEVDTDKSEMIGDPIFKKYEKSKETIDAEIVISLRPKVNDLDYKKIVPKYDEPKVDDKEVDERVAELVKQVAPLESIKTKRDLIKGDVAVFDFEGFLDGEPFDGGKADNFELEIGSGQFIPGFEDEMIGMKIGGNKRIKITFPQDYQAENLKGKDTEFEISLHDIKVKSEPKLDDGIAKKITSDEKATVETLKERTREQVKTEKISKLYNDDLKPQLLEKLVAAYKFDLPQNIVEQEIDNQVNNKASKMTPEEIKELQEDESKLEKLREETRVEAVDSVRATFVVDALAKAEGISVDDQEASQAIYYEAMMSGQKPEELLEYYQKNNLLAAVKMGMMEDKLFGKLLGIQE